MSQMTNLPPYIGTAHIEKDGTIVLNLSRTVGDIIFHDTLKYAKDNPNYNAVNKHIGEPFPGQMVSVRPWQTK